MPDENPSTVRLQEYLRIRTDHPKPEYKGAVAFLKKQAQRIGLPAKVYGKTKDKPMVLITWEGKNKALPSIVLISHMDVVPVDEKKWTHDPFAGFKTPEGKIFGRGAQDMKSQGISYLEALDQLKCENFTPNRTIHALYTSDGEIGGKDGIIEFINTPRFNALNVGFAIDQSCAGSRESYLVFNDERANWALTVTCHGTPGHGSLLMPNTAGEKARIIMDEFHDRRQKEAAKLTGKSPEAEHGNVTTINLTMLDGGVQQNCVPESFKMTYDVRLSVLENHDDFDDWIRKVIKKAGEGYCKVSFIRKESKTPPTKLDDSNPFWLALKAAVEKFGLAVVAAANPGTSEARHLRGTGVPVIGFTAIRNTPNLAHAHDEYIHEKIFLEGIKVYKEVIAMVSSVGFMASEEKNKTAQR